MEKKKKIVKMFISMKESRIENNKSFYGCFSLGSFESGQSLTVANALRRSLLSDCPGLAVISVKIENVQHEYSTLPGVRDSVLDILLNFKELGFKKRKNPLGGPNGYKNKGFSSVYDKLGSSFFKPVVGYLKVKGPGVIRAKDLRLPPFIQCVDPNQYIATLSQDGILNVKFVIMEGKSYYIQNLTSQTSQDFGSSSTYNSSVKGKANRKTKSTSMPGEQQSDFKKMLPDSNDPSNYGSIMKKRQNLLRKLKEIMVQQGNNSLSSKIPNLSVPSTLKNDSPGMNQQASSPFFEKTSTAEPFPENSKQLNIDAIFNPVTKVNYVIEKSDNYIVESFNEKYNLIDNLTSFLDSSTFLETNFPYFQKQWDTSVSETPIDKETLTQNKNGEARDKKELSKNILDYLTNLSSSDLEILSTPENDSHYKGIEIPSFISDSILPITVSKDSFEQLFPSGLKANPKEVVLLEIWTNGTLHPRDALLMSLKNLSSTFSPDKVKMTTPIFHDSASYTKIMQSF